MRSLAIRYPVAGLFAISLLFAAYLGFASLQLNHDKLIHFTTFFVLTAEFYYMWDLHRPWKLTLVCMTGGAAVASEFVQNVVNPARRFDWFDILCNVHGSGFALVMCMLQSVWATRRAYRPESEYVHISMADVRDAESG